MLAQNQPSLFRDLPFVVRPREVKQRRSRTVSERQLMAGWSDYARRFRNPPQPCLWCRDGQATRVQSIVKRETDYDYCKVCRERIARHLWGLWGRAEICGKCSQAISIGCDGDGVPFKLHHFFEGCGADTFDADVTFLPSDYDCIESVQMLSPFRERIHDDSAARYHLGPWYVVRGSVEVISRERLKYVGGAAELAKAERHKLEDGGRRTPRRRTW